MHDQPRESRRPEAAEPSGPAPPGGAYDDVIALAAATCGCRTALVRLTGERPAAVGDAAVTEALFAATLGAGGIVVVADLADDPRVPDGAHGFYAGVPIRAGDGEALGVLCVVDDVPRSIGLDAGAGETLVRIARLAAVRAERERTAADGADRHWRELFEKLSDGFVVGELVRGADGRAIDWTYLDVNAAWSTLTGIPPERAIGRSIRELFPDDAEDVWIDETAAVVETRRPRTFTRAVGTPVRQYEGHAFHLDDDRFAVVLIEVTDRQRAAARQAALLTLGDRLRDLTDIGAMTREAARLVGETLDVSRAAFGRIDAGRGTILIEPDWTAKGVANIAGEHRFADHGWLIDDLVAGDAMVVDDVHTDARTAGDLGPMLAMDIAALVNIPVRERGRTVAAFLVHDRSPRAWTEDELAFLRNVADRVEVGVARLQAESRQAVMNGELAHRMKNLLALVQAIAAQTLAPAAGREAMGRFERRLGALATAHQLLLGQGAAADLETVARRVLGVIAPDRITIAGPPVDLGARAAVSLSLVLHELGTNAAKYGALSVERGEVVVRWQVDGDLLTLGWREMGGPPARPPERRGFGTRLIGTGLTGSGSVDVEYAPAGFSATLRSSVAELQAE